MTDPMPDLPPDLAELESDFALLDNWEDRYRYVMELGRGLPGLPDEAKTDATRVRGCASQVWLVAHAQAGADPILLLDADSDAHIVRGLAAILLKIYTHKRASEIVATDALAFFARLGLKEHLTPQRANGLASMDARIKAEARALVPGA